MTPWTAARQASLSITNSWGLLKLMSIELVMPSNHLVFCHPLLLLPSIFSSIRVFSNESAVYIRWAKYWSFSFSISPSIEYSELTSFRIDWFDLLAVCEFKQLTKTLCIQQFIHIAYMCISNTFLVDHVLFSCGILKNCITFMYSNLSFIYLFSSKAVAFWTLFLKRIDTLLKPLSRFYNKMIMKSLLICSFEHLDSLYLKQSLYH